MDYVAKKKNIFNKSMNISRNVQRWGKKMLTCTFM